MIASYKHLVFQSTDHQLFELSKTKSKKGLDLVCAPQPDSAEGNTKQVDGPGAISAIGL